MGNDPGEEPRQKVEPDFVLSAIIRTPREVVDNVRCKIYLPRGVMESPRLHFEPTKEQSNHLIVPAFSFEAKDVLLDGEPYVSVRAKTVWAYGPTVRTFSPTISECSLEGHPWDLEVIERVQSREANEGIRHCVFWLTPNRLLEPARMIEDSYTGETKVRTVRETSIPLSAALIHFRRHFRFEKTEAGSLRFDELVAEAGQAFGSESLGAVVEELDDVLLLASIAARQRSVCRGWQYMEGDHFKRIYRSRLIAPPQRRILSQDTLIDTPYMQDFLSRTFPIFRKAEHSGRLRRAMNLVLDADQGYLEGQFLQLFTAMETLVTRGRESLGLTKILDEGQWKTFKANLNAFIKRHPSFDTETDRMALVLEKLGELNRVSLASAFRELTASLAEDGLDLSDLWPVTGEEDGVSLSGVRNRLVHGHVHEEEKSQALFVACFHLRWCVERLILAILNWPVERSLVGRFLKNIVPYNNWKSSQKALSRRGAG